MLMPHCSLAIGLDTDRQTEEEQASLRAIEEARAAEATEAPYQTTGEAVNNPTITNPVCNMEATVTSIGVSAANPDYYDVKVEIKNMTVSQATTESACGGVYQRQIEKTGQIMRASDYQNEPVEVGDDINAQVQLMDEGDIQGYFLSNTTVTSSAAPAAAAQGTAEDNNSIEEKADSTKILIGAFSLVTLLILVGMIYASRDKSKKS
jgi:hypothetical protein